MPDAFRLIKGFVPQNELEFLIQQTMAFKGLNYTDENLAAHRTYLSDTTEHRTSHAYAVSRDYLGVLPTLYPFATESLLGDISEQVMYQELELTTENRVLFNVQEYFGSSEPVPCHNDGELLEFTTENGGLQIKRSIRPDEVAVLTLVNDTDCGGTRVHYSPEISEVVRAEAGDLLIFKNSEVKHSVDALTGTVKRPDGILRMTIGWRSLGDNCFYEDEKGMFHVTKDEAEKITAKWYREEWPQRWAAIVAASQKAAF